MNSVNIKRDVYKMKRFYTSFSSHSCEYHELCKVIKKVRGILDGI